MELSSLSENIVIEEFKRNGDTARLEINLDAVVPEYYDIIAERLTPITTRLEALMKQHEELQAEIEKRIAEETKKTKKKSKALPNPVDYEAMRTQAREIQKGVAEINREIFAERLTCPVRLPDGSFTSLLKGWDTTVNGEPVPASKEYLLKLPPQTVEAIFVCVAARLETVKKKVDGETEETLESTPSGSRAPLALAPTG